MTIKRSQLAAWLDATCDKTKPYILSAVVDGVRECGMLRWPYLKSFGDFSTIDCRTFNIRPGDDLPWSEVRVHEIEIREGEAKLVWTTNTYTFRPPLRTVTLEADAEKWESLRKKSGCGWSITIDEFVDSAKVKG